MKAEVQNRHFSIRQRRAEQGYFTENKSSYQKKHKKTPYSYHHQNDLACTRFQILGTLAIIIHRISQFQFSGRRRLDFAREIRIAYAKIILNTHSSKIRAVPTASAFIKGIMETINRRARGHTRSGQGDNGQELKSMLQAYKAYYEGGRVTPLGKPFIPEGSELIITVMDAPAKPAKSRAERQREAFMRFMDAMETTPPLPAAFDDILAQRVNITREIAYDLRPRHQHLIVGDEQHQTL